MECLCSALFIPKILYIPFFYLLALGWAGASEQPGCQSFMELPRWHLWQELTSDAIATVALKDSGGEKDFFYQAQLRVEVKNNTRTTSVLFLLIIVA